jgi:HAE1 family hydrophobic/amphiphilic exporter-1
MFSELFIKRPILATVCSLLIILAGAIAIPTLPIARYPDLTPPSVSVSAFYTGANAQAVESAVTTPLEQVINGVEGMQFMRSSSTSTGFSSIAVTFEIGVDADLAAVNVQNRVNQALGRMPAEVRTNGITVTKNTAGLPWRARLLLTGQPVRLAVHLQLRRLVRPRRVQAGAWRRQRHHLWRAQVRDALVARSGKLAGRGITGGDVVNALREQNVQVAAGSVGDAPSSPEQLYQLSVRAGGRLSGKEQFEDVVVKSAQGGALVRVRDVGRVELGAESYTSNLRFAGVEASGVGIQLLPTANAIQVFTGIQHELERLRKNFPPGLEAQIAFDNVVVVQESIVEVLKTLAEAIGLVVLVMFLFLQNWRSTLIPAITIPVSLVGTFAFVKLFGFSINTLTLFGIVLATGIVVDDAIVVIENVERHMREYGKNAHEAAIDAMREVFSAVIVIGIVLVAVFVPVAFFPGTTGRMYQQFSLTIAFSVVLSVFNALTFTPALSALLLDKHVHRDRGFFKWVNKVIDGGTHFYVGAGPAGAQGRDHHADLVRRRSLGDMGGVSRGAVVVRSGRGRGLLHRDHQAPSGSSLEYTTNIAKQAEQIIMKQEEVLAVFSGRRLQLQRLGAQSGTDLRQIETVRGAQREDQSLHALLGPTRLGGQLMGITGAIVAAFAPPAIQGLQTFGGFTFEVLDGSGGDISNLAGVTYQMMGAGNAPDSKVMNLFSSFTANDPQLVVQIDRDRARSLGLPIREITDALSVFLGSQYVNDFDFNNRAYRVYVQADQRFRASPSNLRQYYARAQNGQMVPLDTVVRLSESTAPAVIGHFNMYRSTQLQGSPKPGVSSGQAIDYMQNLAGKVLPPGFDYAWSGQSLEEIRAGSTAVYLFGLAIIIVYLILAAQYESWVLPFIILLGVPLAVFGALTAQLLRGFTNDVFCQVGLVMLIGLAAKNSILIVEFAEHLRKDGRSIVDAAVEAARIRLRPILMTSFAFILGVLPLAYATGAGSGARNSVGTTVAGGMLASTFLSIIFIPVLYVAIRTIAPGKRPVHEEVEVA